MRNPQFIAEHRGGPLVRRHHYLLAAWAADCAEHVLPLFAAHAGGDDRPSVAVATARVWARGEIPVGVAQKAAVAAHAAARAADAPEAVAAARAAGHAVATAHFAEHSLGAALYALKAVAAAGGDVVQERAWQIEQLPAEIRDLVIAGLQSERLRHFKIEAPSNSSAGTRRRRPR
jgi:hypothetical protein